MTIKLRAAAIVTFFPAARKTTSASASVAGAVGDGASPPASAATVRGPDETSDVGALKKQPRRAQTVPCPTACPEDSVGYCHGNHTIGAACDGDCCTSENNDACGSFTGCVKRDGSCTGPEACYYAHVPDGIEKSCQGVKACAHLGDYGSVEKISNSCNADSACLSLGKYFGKVGKISDSCNADSACANVGGHYGDVGKISNSCNAKKACLTLGAYRGSIKSIEGSCNSNADQPCRDYLSADDGYHNADVGHLVPLSRKWTIRKYHTTDLTVCKEDCDNNVECKGITWRQGAKKQCRTFKGGFSGKCGKKDLCFDK